MVKRSTRERCRRIELSAVKYEQFDTDPSKMQLVEARNFSALELSRAIGVPAYLLGIGISGYNYSNATQAKQDLYC
jgi:phage portal protein BeeE